MSHPHGENVPKKPKSAQTKSSMILFMASSGGVASLVTTIKQKQSATVMQFVDPQAALAWAIDNRAGFVFFQGERAELN